jgi:diaminohydroxyphosphoribosylaminopyrimidine deaminase/5-amino-6-(5-phosphoribosylamino)uracil reductase
MQWADECLWAAEPAFNLQVVVGVVDPNPLVGGEGIRTLKKAGVQVLKIGGKEELECYAINESFMKGMEAGSKA